jgi:NADH dehydrogenase (ubiquinone) 1 beta subcomplex subunit 5
MGYQYLFVGPATLTEIPDGYEPRYYEYHKNPIKRFLAQYFFDIPEKAYEEHLNFLYREQCKQKMRY